MMESITNFVQMTSRIATAGQPKADEFKSIAEAGYNYVINLGMLDHPHAVVEENKLVSDLGLTYLHIPVVFDSPSKEQVRFFCNVMSVLNEHKVFVHCIMNFRVSAFMYHYLSKVEKLPEVQAKSLMFEYWELDPVWEELMSWSSEKIGL
jgi:protein tyrosine phosphatase (PTP) superfamily phosphohydrolase (DUF442 family)